MEVQQRANELLNEIDNLPVSGLSATVLCYIVADRWQHNSYGRKLRRMVVDSYAVEAMFEMHGVDAFADEVSAYPAITQIRMSPQGRVSYATARPSFGEESARKLVAWAANSRTRQSSGDDYMAAKLPEWFATDDVAPSALVDAALDALVGRGREG